MNKKVSAALCGILLVFSAGAAVCGEENYDALNGDASAVTGGDYLPEGGQTDTYEVPEAPAPDDAWTEPDTQWVPVEPDTTWTEAPQTDAAWTEEPQPDVTWTESPAPDTVWTEEPQPDATWTEAPAPDTAWTEPQADASWSEPSYDDGSWQEDWRDGVEYEEPENENVHEGFNMGSEVGTIRRRTDQRSRVEDFDIPGAEEAEKDFGVADKELPTMFYLNVPQILQRPELPTGCESVALTMALQYEGIDVDKLAIVEDFLIYNYETDNMALGYIGDPFSEEGAGCFAPTIAATAEELFRDQELDYQAYDISGTEFEDLFAYVASGTPVVLWTTMYMMEPEFTGDIAEYDGRVYRWYTTEHCVVLSGYNLAERTVQINDPLEGIVTRDIDSFADIYTRTGQNAVVLGELPQEEQETETPAGSVSETNSETQVGINS